MMTSGDMVQKPLDPHERMELAMARMLSMPHMDPATGTPYNIPGMAESQMALDFPSLEPNDGNQKCPITVPYTHRQP